MPNCIQLAMASVMFLVKVLMLISSTLPCQDVMRYMERPLVIGAISNGGKTRTTPTLTRYNCNISIAWHFIDMGEPYQIYRKVHNLDRQADVDLIVLFEYSSIVLRGINVLETKMTPLVKWKRQLIDGEHTEDVINDIACPQCNQTEVTDEDMGVNSFYCEKYPSEAMALKSKPVLPDDLPEDTIPRVIADIVTSQKWKVVVILHDYMSALDLNSIVKHLSESGVLVQTFNTDHIEDLHSTVLGVYMATPQTLRQINMVVVCRFACLVNILRTANQFDHLNVQRQTILKHISRWVFVVHGHSRRKSAILQTIADDLDHVVLLTVPDVDLPGKEAFAYIVEEILVDIYREDTTEDTVLTTGYFAEKLPKKLAFWHPASRCLGYYIESLMMRKEGREFSSVGFYTHDGKITLHSALFPNTNYGFGRRQFTVATLPYPPFVIKRQENGHDIYEGSFMELLMELARVLNFTYELVEPADGKWGSFVIEENFTFNGLVGMLQRKEADIVVTPLSIQAEREKVVDFAYTVYHDFTTVLMRKPDPYAKKWKTLLSPLKWEVLVLIGISMFIASVIIFLIEKFGGFYTRPKNEEKRRLTGGLNYLPFAVWYIYGALLCQGSKHLPRSIAGRIFVSSWCFFCIMIVGIYSGNLIAFLTVTKTQPAFNSLAEMVKLKDSMKWGTLGGTFWVVVLETSRNPIFREVGKAMNDFYKEDPSILDVNTDYHINRVKHGDYAWIGDISTMEVYMSKECDLMTIKEVFMPMRYAFAFQENSPFTTTFSDQIIKILEGGLMEMWKRKWWPKADFCSTQSVAEAKPITVADVQSAFYICAIGAVLGTLAFICEQIVYRCMRHRKMKSNITNVSSEAACSSKLST